MYKSFRKRVISGVLAGLMVFSNVNIPTIAADTVENEIISEEGDSYEASVQSTNETEAQTIQIDGIDVIDEDEVSSAETDAADETEMQQTDGLTIDSYAVEGEEEIAGAETAGQEASGTVVAGTFQISGHIDYNENLNGMDWSALVRPSEFDQPIKITQTYTDSRGEVRTAVYDAQDDLSQNAFYLKFVHDGQGGGDFVIGNVPKSVKDADGVACQVTSYSVNVEPNLPYYNATTPITIPITNPENITASIGTLTLALKSQSLTLQPTVTPTGSTDNPSFTMKATFTNPQLTGEAEKDRKLDASYRPTKDAPTTIQVPVGIAYNVTQQVTDGYRFDGTYSTTTKKDETESGPVSSKDRATGTMKEGTDVTVSTVNYAQNLSIGFDVQWLDNNSATRPSISEDNFVLQYKTADGNWEELTSEKYASLNIEAGKAPKFDSSNAALGQYAYTGLPAVDADGNALEYQVLVKENPDGYVSSYTDESGRRKFIFEEQTSFSATIEWRDAHKQDSRPDGIGSLKLYRRVENGTYKLVYGSLPEGAITSAADGKTWNVTVSNLPRYNAQNQEYDYVLVQGSMDEKGTVTPATIDHYQTYYDNGTGSYGNDIERCHNDGTIKEVLYNTVNFQAEKVWKDPSGTAETRPDATVTLWRYVKGTADSIDDAYTKGVAAQVVFQTTNTDGTVEENIVSYQLDKANGTVETPQDIAFTSTTVSGMPEGYQLPAYDDHGQEYVYFVRESLTGTDADEFEVQYTGTTQKEDGTVSTVTYQNGVPVGGTITNLRRKKESVNITKVWRNQDGLKEIEGVSVRVEIKASADGETYEDLTVYSDADGSYEALTGDAKKNAQTITGFAANLPQSEVSYYVNTCDSQGRPYDMTTAQIVETVITKDGKEISTTTADGYQIIELNGNQYVVGSAYQSTVELGDGTNQYRYQQTNTITALRDYTLIKEWDKSISDAEIQKIQSVNFKLERRSTKEQADGTAAEYEEVVNDSGKNLWTVVANPGTGSDATSISRTWEQVLENLPKYDSEGYEYYYRATEISFTDVNGTTFTTQAASEDSNRKWGAMHYRTPEQTKVVNYKAKEGGRGYFTVSKVWQDNGDTIAEDETSKTRKEVQVRVYSRAALKAALETLKNSDASVSDDTVVDLGQQLAGVKYYSTTLTSGNQYTAFLNYADLEKAIGKVGTDGQDRCTDYIVLEYAVGAEADGAKSAQYPFSQLMAAADGSGVYTLSGTVENTMRKYRTTTTFGSGDNSLVLLTNTRIGTTEIHAEKNWNDENNSSGLRPQRLQFRLYQDGVAYTNIPENVTVTMDTNAETGETSEPEAGDPTTEPAEGGSETATFTVSLDHSTGIVTVTAGTNNTVAKWAFTITGLDMFSSTAVPHSYNLDEVASTDSTGTQRYSYIQRKVSATTNEDKTQTCSFTFTNTLTCTVDHIAYKYWKDASIGASHRPDLYMNLYRYLKKDLRELQETVPNATADDLSSDKLSLYTDYKDQVWTAEPETPSTGDYETGYNWKITVENLPRFDADGNEYGYVFKEVMNNGGRTVLGTYQPSKETKQVPGTNADADTYEVFTNTITDYMTVHGRKTWSGFEGYQIKEKDLPDPLITLYRTVDPNITNLQNKTDTEISELAKAETITQVDTTHLSGSKSEGNDRTRYTFPDAKVTDDELNAGLICKVGEKMMLPKFDAEGRRYTYLVRETMEDPLTGQLYSEINANGTLMNVFRSDVNRRQITVTKSWAGRENLKDSEKKYPSVTYTLYRYEPSVENGVLTAVDGTTVKIASHTIQSSEFTGQNGQASYTFKDLLIYSPNGVQYCYYIEETGINGYTVSYTDEPGIVDGTLANTTIRGTSDGKISEITVTADMLEALKTNSRIDIISPASSLNQSGSGSAATENDSPANSDAADGTGSDGDTSANRTSGSDKLTVSCGTTNTYNNPGIIQISGQKLWDDYGNSEGLRPDKIAVTLKRHTNNESGQSNKIDPTDVTLEVKTAEDKNITTPYIVWEKGTTPVTSATWSYKIYNLERYAPNGMPYIYTLSEDPVTGYKQADQVTGEANKADNQSGQLSVTNLVNRFDGSYYVRKNWMDGNNKYNLRPQNITVKLQRSADGGKTWNDISWQDGFGTWDAKTGKWAGLPSVMNGSDGKPIVSITLDASYVIKNTKNSSWEYTFQNLPTQNKDGQTYTYRCEEVAIGGVPLTEKTKDGVTKYIAGAYERNYTTQDDKKTVIENILDSTSLIVKKQWVDDQNNLYQSRPDQLTFVLQKRSVRVANETGGTTDSGSDQTPETTSGTASTEGELSDWTTVTNADGTPYTFTISAEEGWTKTLEDLPTAEVVIENGTTYMLYSLYFRAVEVHADDTKDTSGKTVYGTGTRADGAQNYQDTTDYSLNSNDHTYDISKGCNVSTITNELIRDDQKKEITVTKNWRRVAGSEVSATFELLYKTAGESDWHCYGDQNLQTVTSTAAGTSTVTWNDLPKYDLAGNELVYKVIEHPVAGYKTEVTTGTNNTPYPTSYTFTNIELQSYTVQKIWQTTDYAEKTDAGYTATFQLQQKIGVDEKWVNVTGKGYSITLTSTTANDDSKTKTWYNLPKYTTEGTEITYRAVETQINGKNVTGDTNGSYIVSYRYFEQQKAQQGGNAEAGVNAGSGNDEISAAQLTGKIEPAFGDTETVATNRMIYGFVNLSKQAAYLAPGITPAQTPATSADGTQSSANVSLAGVTFDLYKVDTGNETLYASDIVTNANGNLVNEDGKYGKEKKYLISGTYLLKETSKETSTLPEYSVWADGVTFTVGSGKTLPGSALTDTGEHGTAWISTSTTVPGGSIVLGLQVEYQSAVSDTTNPVTDHTYEDDCRSFNTGDAAVNLESRGVLSFTKTGPKAGSGYTALDTHGNAAGESSAYFGVYLDEECTQQVAGLAPKANVVSGSTDKTTMVLTNQTQNGEAIAGLKTANGVPYLRAYSSASDSDYPFTLLSGTYYIKELVAPAGYKLDTVVRKAVIDKIDSTALNKDLTTVYPSNKAKITILTSGSESGNSDYQWSNEPNVVTLYKMDQYGRKVPLSGNGYLELKVEGNGNTFPSGENTIRLYQNADAPATKTDGTAIGNYISYDTNTGAWTIKGLLDINKTYTLSEPADSVHANYIVAKPISFKMNADGSMELVSRNNADTGNTDTDTGSQVSAEMTASGDDTQKANVVTGTEDPLLKKGEVNYKNSYNSDTANNRIVMRDVARYVKNIALLKKDSETDKPIANISFELYKYTEKDENGNPTGVQSVLEKDKYLTTDTEGKISLENQELTNLLTGCALKYGLDVGTYYFKEVERGASDQYRLLGKIYFEITPKTGGTATDYRDYAEVIYNTADSHVFSESGDKIVTVTNDPVTDISKTLVLTKVDSENQETKLANAKFTLTYKSINHGHAGSSTGGNEMLSWNCMTDENGVLYLVGENGKLPENISDRKKPDISAKGSYTLKETKAPDGYMTRTEDGKTDVVTMITFDVGSDNQIKNIKRYTGAGELVTNEDPIISGDQKHPQNEHIALNVTVKNEKTKVSIAKRNDIVSSGDKANTKTCDQTSLNGELLSGATLEIYEGVYKKEASVTLTPVATLGNNQSEWNWQLPDGTTTETSGAYLPAGTLKEDTIYTLHESSAPVGYLAADDIYFKLSGTTTKNGTVVSQLYVWTGSGTPGSVSGDGWTQTTKLNDNVLTMVDEAIIAPVDMQKVVGNAGKYKILPGAIFEVRAKSSDRDIILGKAVSADNGYLVWKEITEAGYASRLIFNADGKRVSDANDTNNRVLGNTIILQQNAKGYTFTETYAPDHAYNDGRTYHVSITAENYQQYRSETGTGYQTDKYINLAEAESSETHQVSQLSTRGTKTTYNGFSDVDATCKNADDVSKKLAVNLPYKSTVTLHKYDGDEEGQKAAIPGTEFTLYRGSVSAENVYKKASVVYADGSAMMENQTGVFTTDANGNISIEIHEKGTYILRETKAATGYQIDSDANTFTFTLADKPQTDTDGKKSAFGYNETNTLSRDTNGVPNSRLTGEVSLTKLDNKTGELLNGVVYTLTRNDVPKAAPTSASSSGESTSSGADLTEYLLKDPVEVVTGKSYKAEKVNGNWQLTEITDSSQCKPGEIHIAGLNWGSYTLTEKTELPGYKLETKNHTFVINGRGNALSFSYTDTNTKNSVTFYKTNQVDEEAGITEQGIKALEGAVFEVHEGDGSDGCQSTTAGHGCTKASFYTSDTDKATDGNGNSNQKTTAVTGSDGKVTIYGLPTDTAENAANPKTYHLVEVKAPKGYKIQTTPVVFTIDRQGNVQIKNANGTFTNANPAGQVKMEDEPIKIYIQKLGEDDDTKLKGAEFTLTDVCSNESGENGCDHKLANGSYSEEIEITADNGKILIPIERLIGGHTYKLKETKAPDGYECTAAVTFHVKTDGTIDTITSTGGYTTAESGNVCASTNEARTTINIKDEKIRMSLTKVDYDDANKKLSGVTFTLTPYGKASDKRTDSSFVEGYDNTGLTYDKATNTYTFTTDTNGTITFPDGLLKHDNSYLLKETATADGYYLSKEAKDGVILTVRKDGSIKITRLEAYDGKTTTNGGKDENSCPVSVSDTEGKSDLNVTNRKATSFELTKKVEGNMGDLNATFQIKMEVYEPDGTPVGTRTVNLKLNETYDSVNGIQKQDVEDKQAFGRNAIPVGATLVISEANDLDYTAVVRITSTDGQGTVLTKEPADKGTVKVTLDTAAKVSIELTNKKEVTLDVGVITENQAPLAAVALLIPALWLAYRYRRKRKGGEASR